MSHVRIEIYKHFKSADADDQDEYGWRLIAGNGEQVAQGEGHRTPRDAERAFRTVVSTVLLAVGFKVATDTWSVTFVDDGDLERAVKGSEPI